MPNANHVDCGPWPSLVISAKQRRADSRTCTARALLTPQPIDRKDGSDMPTTPRPDRLTLRAYQVGFGDCFLLTFHYPKQSSKPAFDRHVLIDFGSTGKPKNAPKDYM